MTPASIFEQLESRTIAERFPLLERLAGTDDYGTFLTVLDGKNALIKLRPDDSGAGARITQWQAAERLSHPNLLQVHAAGRTSIEGAGFVYVVTERADEVLSNVLPEQALDAQGTLDTLGPVIGALAYLHSRGVIHGHVRPANIFLVGETVKLATDELLLAGGVDRREKEEFGVYDAPELRTAAPTAAADIWSLGITVTEIMTQSLPGPISSPSGAAAAAASLGEPFADVVRDCLRLNPGQRPALERIAERLEISFGTPARAAEQPTAAAPAAPASAEPGEAALPATASAPPASPATARPSSGPARPAAPLFGNIGAGRIPEHLRRLGGRGVALVGGAVVLLVVMSVVALRGHRQRPAGGAPRVAVTGSGPAVAGHRPSAAVSSPSSAGSGAIGSSSVGSSAAGSGSAGSAGATQAARQGRAPREMLPPIPDSGPVGSVPGVAGNSGAQAQVRPALPQIPLEPGVPPGEVKGGSVVRRVMPSIPKSARQELPAPLDVRLRVSVDRNGKVWRVDYVSPGADNYFAQISQLFVWSWRFRPPRVNGSRVLSVWALHFVFSDSGTEATAVEEEPAVLVSEAGG